MTFDYADQAIRDMNKRNLRLFDKLKMLKFDELNVLSRVGETYDESIRIAKRRYLMIAREAFIEAMLLLGHDKERAEKEAEDSITEDWLLDMLEDYDPTTLYQFLPEAERKKQRLVEALIASHDSGQEIERALRLWTRQIASYADRSVIDGTVGGYKEAGVEMVRWVAVEDEKTCPECKKLDGQVFSISEIPPRPHYHCRCVLEPVKENE